MSKAKINKLIKFIMKAPRDVHVDHNHAFERCAIGHYARSIGEEPGDVGTLLHDRAELKGGYKLEVMDYLNASYGPNRMGAVADEVMAILLKREVQL